MKFSFNIRNREDFISQYGSGLSKKYERVWFSSFSQVTFIQFTGEL